MLQDKISKPKDKWGDQDTQATDRWGDQDAAQAKDRWGDQDAGQDLAKRPNIIKKHPVDTRQPFVERVARSAGQAALGTVGALGSIFEPGGLPAYAIKKAAGIKDPFERAADAIEAEPAEDWTDYAADLLGETPALLGAAGIAKKVAGRVTKESAEGIAKAMLKRGEHGVLTSFLYDVMRAKEIDPEQAAWFAGIEIVAGTVGAAIMKKLRKAKPVKNADDLFDVAKETPEVVTKETAAVSEATQTNPLFVASKSVNKESGQITTKMKNGLESSEKLADYPIIVVNEESGLTIAGKGLHADVIPALRGIGMSEAELGGIVEKAMPFNLVDGKIVSTAKLTRKQLDKAYESLKGAGYNNEQLADIAPVVTKETAESLSHTVTKEVPFKSFIKSNEIAHGSNNIDDLESIITKGLRSGSSVGGQAEEYSFVLVYDRSGSMLSSVQHRSGDYITGSKLGRPKKILVNTDDFTSVRSEKDIEKAMMDRLDILEKKGIGPEEAGRSDKIIARLFDEIDDLTRLGGKPVNPEIIMSKAEAIGKKHGIPVLKASRDVEGMEGLTVLETKKVKGIADVVTETKEGLKTSGKKASLNKRIFGTAKAKGIDSTSTKYALQEALGIKDLKFSGPTAITEEQAAGFLTRLRRVKKEWTDSDKMHFLTHGDVPAKDFGEAIPAIESGSPIWESVKATGRGWLQSVDSVLKGMGATGKQVRERTLTMLEFSESFAEKANTAAKSVYKSLTGNEVQAMKKAVHEGTMSKQPQHIQDAFAKIKEHFSHIDGLAKDLGFEVKRMSGKKVPYTGLGDKFWPHMFDADWGRSAKKAEQILQSIMKKNKLSRAEAMKRLEYLASQRKVKRSGNLEFAREFEAGGWMGDHTAKKFSKKESLLGLERYFMESYRRLGEATFLDANGKNLMGEGWKSINELIAEDVSLNNQKILSVIMKKIRGLDPPEMERPFFSAIRNYQIVRLLGLAQIPNMFQSAITVMPKVMTLGIRRGLASVAKGFKDAITKEGREFARDIGANASQHMREVVGLSTRGVSGKVATWGLKITGFSGTESANNIIAATVGRSYIQKVFKTVVNKEGSARIQKLAAKELKEFGISNSVVESGVLTERHLATAAWRMARLTQFRGGALDLPLYWHSAHGRLFTQFKTFSFNIARLAKDHFLKPALKYAETTAKYPLDPSKWEGSVIPLLTFASATIGSGEAIAYIRQGLIRGKDRPENLLERVLEDIMYAGTLGLWYDAYQAVIWGRPLEFIFGPSAGQVSESAQYISQGKMEKLVERQIPRSPLDVLIRREGKSEGF